MIAAKLLAFAGSAREGSWNKKLVAIATDGAREAGAEVRVVDLRDHPMPLFDLDLEEREGLHPKAREFRELMIASDGFLISCPEHNSSITALLKNSIDWASRQQPGEKPFACFADKVVALMSASPGALGGLRGLVHVRAILGNLGMIVLPGQVALSAAHEAFAEDGSLKDAKRHASVRKLGADVALMAAKLRA